MCRVTVRPVNLLTTANSLARNRRTLVLNSAIIGKVCRLWCAPSVNLVLVSVMRVIVTVWLQ